jgi:hypothetical protein
MRFELGLDWVVVAWAALALALATIAWKVERRVFLHQSYLIGLAVLFRALFHNFYERSYFAADFWHSRWWSVGTTVAILFLVLPVAFKLSGSPDHPRESGNPPPSGHSREELAPNLAKGENPLQPGGSREGLALSLPKGGTPPQPGHSREGGNPPQPGHSREACPPRRRGSGNPLARIFATLDRHPEQLFFFIPVFLLTVLLALEMRSGMVTVAWGLEAVAVFIFALWVGQRSFRLTGLGLLLLCVGKIVVVDIWGLTPRDRYLTFIVLGSLLLFVSYLYTRYRETLRQYL